jgi:hypothetical protein
MTCRVDMLVKPGAKAHPVLNVSPMNVTDSARAGSDDIKQTDLSITNGGDGSFRWTASKDKGWISVEPADGQPPGTVTVSLDAHGMAPGTYQGTITVKAPGTPDSIAAVGITFVIQRAGLNVSPDQITFETNVNSNASFKDTLRISNSGNGILVWTAAKSKSWVSLGAIAGTGPGIVPVTINSSGLSPGTYSDEIVVTAPSAVGSPARIPVTLRVFEPGLAVSPSSLHETADFGSVVPITRELTVGNSGGGTITWNATKSRPWVTLSNNQGGAPPSSNLTVTLNPAGLPSGIYRDTIVFRSPQATNDPVKVPVELSVLRTTLSVDPKSITDVILPGDNAKRTHPLAITNAGAGPISWSAIPDRPWITVNRFANTVGDTITVTVDPAGLPPGTYSGRITVSAPGAENSPQSVDVTLAIQASCGHTGVVPDVVISGDIKNSDCAAPHRSGSHADIYTFTAAPGDTMSLRMSASFDAFLVLQSPDGTVLAQNDDCPSEDRTACIKNLRIAAAGEYTIEATTANPGATGSYQLSIVRELAPGAPQAIGQFKKNGSTALAVGDTTVEDKAVFKGTVSDPNDADEVRLEVELEPLSSPFTNVRTHQSDFVATGNGNTVVSVEAGLVNTTSYHWQARTCDRTGRCSPWLSFGGNPETAADFTMFVGPPPPPPGSTLPSGVRQ